MTFENEYGKFMEMHFKQRKGERLRRLKEGHAHGEKLFLENVWWPAFRHFEYLHPEYEIKDFKDGYRYLDFAYIRQNFQLAIEIDDLAHIYETLAGGSMRTNLSGKTI